MPKTVNINVFSNGKMVSPPDNNIDNLLNGALPANPDYGIPTMPPEIETNDMAYDPVMPSPNETNNIAPTPAMPPPTETNNITPTPAMPPQIETNDKDPVPAMPLPVETDDMVAALQSNGIRDYFQDGANNIYDYVCFKVGQVLNEIGAYDFQSEPLEHLEILEFQTFDNGEMYFGQYNQRTNSREGQGIEVFESDGSIYEGYFKNNERSGKGRYIYANGEVYNGVWTNDKPNGYGIQTYLNGDMYEGDWKDGQEEGKGVIR